MSRSETAKDALVRRNGQWMKAWAAWTGTGPEALAEGSMGKFVSFPRMAGFTPRRLLLLCAAYCRQVEEEMPARYARLISVGERYADGDASDQELSKAGGEAGIMLPREDASRARQASMAVCCLLQNGVMGGRSLANLVDLANQVAAWAAWAHGKARPRVDQRWKEQAVARLEAFGDPLTPRPAWRPEWSSPQVLDLASAAYGQRSVNGLIDPARLGILADALEEAGCDEADLLDHLRGGWLVKGVVTTTPLQHRRGCWALERVIACGGFLS